MALVLHFLSLSETSERSVTSSYLHIHGDTRRARWRRRSRSTQHQCHRIHLHPLAYDSIALKAYAEHVCDGIFQMHSSTTTHRTIVLIHRPKYIDIIWAQFCVSRIRNFRFVAANNSLDKIFCKHRKISAFHVCRCEKKGSEKQKRNANMWNPL